MQVADLSIALSPPALMSSAGAVTIHTDAAAAAAAGADGTPLATPSLAVDPSSPSLHASPGAMSIEIEAVDTKAHSKNSIYPEPSKPGDHHHHLDVGGGGGGDQQPRGSTLSIPQSSATKVKRSSVFSGRPDEKELTGAARGPADEAEEEDAALARSRFARQRSIYEREASSHRLDLFVATFNILVHIGTILTDLMLLSDYSEHDQNVSAGALAVIRIIVGLVEIEFDYLNRGWKNGRWLMIPVIFFNGKIVIDYFLYVKEWLKYRNREWANSDFRATVSFETFIGSLPSLIVQTYVIISDPRPMQQVWVVAFVMTCLSCAIDLLHHFKYVHVDIEIYIAQFFKALISTGLRTVLVAQLLVTIGRVIMAWVILSFLIGFGMYFGAVKYAQKKDRDDPFSYGKKVSHVVFGGLISGTALFVSIPFAPSHSIYDWWIGYLMCELKMAIENFIMLGVVLNFVSNNYRPDVFYSVLIFTLICYIGNLFACWFIHQHVRKQLRARNIYSDTAIVKMFAHLLAYFKAAWYPESQLTHSLPQTQLMNKDGEGHDVEDSDSDSDDDEEEEAQRQLEQQILTSSQPPMPGAAEPHDHAKPAPL